MHVQPRPPATLWNAEFAHGISLQPLLAVSEGAVSCNETLAILGEDANPGGGTKAIGTAQVHSPLRGVGTSVLAIGSR